MKQCGRGEIWKIMLPDAVHPDKEGAAVLAKTVYEGITGDFGGLQIGAQETGEYAGGLAVLFDRTV